MSSALLPPKKKRRPRSAEAIGEGMRPASGLERAGSSSVTLLTLEEQPRAKQPATKQTETTTSPPSSRSVRLAILREKEQNPEAWQSVQAQAVAVALAMAGGDVELPVMGRPSEGNSRPVVEPGPAMEEHSMRNRLCGILFVFTAAIVCVASVADVASTERATELGYMNCVRLSTALYVACFSFSAFLIVR